MDKWLPLWFCNVGLHKRSNTNIAAWVECAPSRLQASVCVRVFGGYVWSRLHGDKNSKTGLRSPAWTSVRKARGNGSRGQTQLCIYSAGIWKWPCTHPPLPPTTHSLTPSFPPLLCWPAPLGASQGRFLPQLGVLGCVAACLYWSVDFLVAACTYLNIPPAAALCSRPCIAPSPPPPSPCPPPASSPPSSLCSLSHPLSLSLLHCGSSHHILSLSNFLFFSLTLSFSS